MFVERARRDASTADPDHRHEQPSSNQPPLVDERRVCRLACRGVRATDKRIDQLALASEWHLLGRSKLAKELPKDVGSVTEAL
jgi:hypothetical protein